MKRRRAGACPTPHKVLYRQRIWAFYAAFELEQKHGKRFQIYRCPSGHGYHIRSA